MAEDKYFYYQDNEYISESNTSYLEIEDKNSKEELLSIYDTHFKFPYFGFNWDALEDSLRCLNEFINENSVVIFHKNLPQLEERLLKIYISVLFDACDFWEKYPDILSFQVYFPTKDQEIIQSFLKTYNPSF